ncbi:MAG: hypothetical protein AB8F65_07735 [Woeseiaceae bacterium]
MTNIEAATDRYCRWLDYQCVEQGELSPLLARSWRAPDSAGAPFTVLKPASGRAVYLRLVQAPAHADYRPLRTFGWNAIEICVNDVHAVAERMATSPFEIIGPPQAIEGLSAILPMQVRGPDNEIVYFTEIRSDLPDFDLPRASSLIDSLFILVMGCSDLALSREWIKAHLCLDVGRSSMALVYTMISKAYGQPEATEHVIATMIHEKDVFLELDQYPAAATTRQRQGAFLYPGVSIGTFMHPQFEQVAANCEPLWTAPPAVHDSCVYAGRRSATVAAPDGTLFEIVDGH